MANNPIAALTTVKRADALSHATPPHRLSSLAASLGSVETDVLGNPPPDYRHRLVVDDARAERRHLHQRVPRRHAGDEHALVGRPAHTRSTVSVASGTLNRLGCPTAVTRAGASSPCARLSV